jgi:hypothetical protein
VRHHPRKPSSDGLCAFSPECVICVTFSVWGFLLFVLVVVMVQSHEFMNTLREIVYSIGKLWKLLF